MSPQERQLTYTCHLQALAHKKHTPSPVPYEPGQGQLESWVQFPAQPVKKDSHQMEGVWNEEKVCETKCLRDVTCPHIKELLQKGREQTAHVRTDTGEIKELILQNRF